MSARRSPGDVRTPCFCTAKSTEGKRHRSARYFEGHFGRQMTRRAPEVDGWLGGWMGGGEEGGGGEMELLWDDV